MSIDFAQLGPAIRDLRKANGVKQKSLQQAITHSCNLSKIETGKAALPVPVFFEVLTFFNMTCQEFVDTYLYHIVPFKIPAAVNMNQLYMRISGHEVRKQIDSLIDFKYTSFDDFQQRPQKLMFHRLSCFHHLNFEKHWDKAKKHALELFHYYHYIINTPSLNDLDLLPLMLPFVTLTEAEMLLQDLYHFKKRNPSMTDVTKERYDQIVIRSYLALAKSALKQQDPLYLSDALEAIFQQLHDTSYPHYYSEALILKGILFYKYENQYTEGTGFIQSGLKIAFTHNFANITSKWTRYCQRTLQIPL